MPKGKGPGAPYGNKNAAGPHKGYHGRQAIGRSIFGRTRMHRTDSHLKLSPKATQGSEKVAATIAKARSQADHPLAGVLPFHRLLTGPARGFKGIRLVSAKANKIAGKIYHIRSMPKRTMTLFAGDGKGGYVAKGRRIWPPKIVQSAAHFIKAPRLIGRVWTHKSRKKRR